MLPLAFYYDIFLWIIVGSFVVWELVASLIFKNKEGHTLSNRIWALQQRHPKVRVATAVACLVLALHLTVRWI